MSPEDQHLETTAITAGRDYGGKSLAPPLWASSAFEIDSVADGQRLATKPKARDFYSRYGNPTVNAFEDAVAELEGAEAAQAFGSGMGAVASTVTYVVPVVSTILGAVVLSEALHWNQPLGVLVLLVGIAGSQGRLVALWAAARQRTRWRLIRASATPGRADR